jgi:hypothetical protein
MFEKLVEWCPNAATSQDITVPTLLSVLSFASLVQFEGSVSSIPTFFQDRLQKIPRQTPPNTLSSSKSPVNLDPDAV